MIQQSQTTETQNPIENVFEEIAMYVQHDDHLKQMFINLGQALASEIVEPDRSLPATKNEVPVLKYSDVQIEQMICDLIYIVSNQFELSDKAMLCNIGEEFKGKHRGSRWVDMGFLSLSCALEIHLPESYMLSPCRKFVTIAADVGQLNIANGICSTAEAKPFKKHHVKAISLNMKKLSRKIKKPKEFSTEVLEVRALFSNINMQRITCAGQGPTGEAQVRRYEEALGVKVNWVVSRKKSSHKKFVEKVLTTKPELVLQSKLCIGHKESELLRMNCKVQDIPHVIVTKFGGVDILAHNILEQASEQLQIERGK